MDPVHHRYSRRHFTRLLGLSALALPAALQPRGADAAIGWCRRDPIFSLDGKVGHVYLATPEDMARLNNSSTDVLIAHPHKAKTKLIWVDPVGFGTGEGISCNFKEMSRTDSNFERAAEGYEIEIRVHVPARSDEMPIRVEFAPAPGDVVTAFTEGYANEWITLRALLP